MVKHCLRPWDLTTWGRLEGVRGHATLNFIVRKRNELLKIM